MTAIRGSFLKLTSGRHFHRKIQNVLEKNMGVKTKQGAHGIQE